MLFQRDPEMKFFFNYVATIFLLVALSLNSNVYGHSVQVGYCVSCNGELTLYVEHWHGNADPSTTTMTIQMNINGVLSTVTGSPTANIHSLLADLPGCSNPVTIFASCPGLANTYNDWVVYHFPNLPCGVPIIITVISGNSVFTEDGCNMYPAATGVITVPCTSHPPPVAATDQTICSSDSATLTLTGFVAAIQWQKASSSSGPWTNIAGATTTPLSTGPLTTTTYYRALETGACESNMVTVTVKSTPTSNAGTDIVTCPTNVPGNIGTANTAGYVYSWSPAGGLSSITVSNPFVLLSTSGTTTYTVTTSIAGLSCVSSDSVVVKINPTPLSNAGTDITTCTSNISDSLGTTPTLGYTYSWSPATNLSSATISNPSVSLNNPSTNSYIVTTTALGCSSADTVVVLVNPLPTASISGTATVCKNAAAPNITFTGAAGTAPYTFTYTINAGPNLTISSTSGNSVTAAAPTSAAGILNYDLLSVQDASSTLCSQTQSGNVAITVNPLPTATITGTTTVCENDTQPNITFTGAVGTAPYTFTYTINGGANQTVVTTSGNSVAVPASTSAAGTFIYSLVSVQEASATACSQLQSGSATVIVNPLPTSTITGTTIVCKNDVSPNITFTGAAGTAPYTFIYTINSGINHTISTTSGNSVTVSAPTNTAGVYTYSLISVQDASTTACSQTQNGGATVTVNPLPTATISGTMTVCKNAVSPNITFTGAIGTAPYTFTYSINGGTNQTISTTSGNSVTIAVPTTTTGSFIYSLISVQDASSTACSQLQSGTATVIVNPLPTATIAGSVAVCKNDTTPNITFTGANAIAPYTFTYTINGGANQSVVTNTGNSIIVAVPTNIADTFFYALVSVKDASSTHCSQAQSGSATVIVNPLPVANFNFTNVCLHQAMNFYDSSKVASGTITNWSWNFGDNSFLSTTQNTTHTYTNAGTDNVSLIVTTNNGCKDTIAKNVIVHPLPHVLYHSANVCDGSIVYFNDLSTIPATDTIQSGKWNISVSSPFSFNQNTNHLFSGPGSYPVKLTDVSYFGCSDSITETIVVNPNPIVNFKANDTAGCSPKCITFIDLSSILTGTYSSLWNFGDGHTGSEPNHCYTNDSIFTPLSFNISLKETSDSGCVSTLSKNNYINVYPNPHARFTVQPDTTTIMNPVISFTNLSVGANFWNWDFGDHDTASVFNPAPHTYADTGKYKITLITSTLYGCKDQSYETIFIEPDFSFYIPNSFSPNDDGINDTFSGKGIFITTYEMMIFDRWGNLIFFTNDINKPWDGTANYGTKIAQEDVYIYSIKLTDINKGKHNYRGIVTLLR